MNWITAFLSSCLVVALCVAAISRARRARRHDACDNACRVLRGRMLLPLQYRPAADASDDDPELRAALESIERTGLIVVDPAGNLVGRLLPPPPTATGPIRLRLVVDNTARK